MERARATKDGSAFARCCQTCIDTLAYYASLKFGHRSKNMHLQTTSWIAFASVSNECIYINSFICEHFVFISSSTKNEDFRRMIFMQPSTRHEKPFFRCQSIGCPFRIDDLCLIQ